MFGSQILDVAIGIIFVYLLLSLMCSALNEIIEARIKNRAKSLELGIRNLLGNNELANDFYNHPLISGLFKDNQKPSYIPSRTFALALMNIVAPQAGADGPNPLQSFRKTISEIKDESPAAPIKNALLALADDAQGDISKLRANVENWYDDTMDRVSGWYKRRTQTIIVFLGFGIAIALNADTAHIARSLSNDAALRNSLVAASQAFAQKENPGGSATATSTTAPETQTPQSMFNENMKRIRGLGLPIGWNLESDDPHVRWPGLRVWSAGVPTAWYEQVRFHWLGWILTALAISLGAPFWFDMLNKFITVRSAVKPKKAEETS
jgi:hypothetical protein